MRTIIITILMAVLVAGLLAEDKGTGTFRWKISRVSRFP